MNTLSTMVNKRARRSPSDMLELRAAICRAVAQDSPTTCRSVFYRLVSAGAIEKTESAYKGIVIRLLTAMRRDGDLSWDSITDGTRLRQKPNSYDSLAAALEDTRVNYRRDLWKHQDAYVEVWSEKDAISGVLCDVTWEWDVPLLVCRGYPSQTYLYGAAQEISAQRKPAWIYYLGDHDPSGVDISRNVEQRLREYAPRAEIHFERLAVTREQIETMRLPTRPTKTTDSRSRNFEGESVEVDAIPPEVLRTLVRTSIEQHIDDELLERTRIIEQVERATLEGMMKFPGVRA